MSLTYGFYDSLEGDRVYSAAQFGSIFNGIINDGVFASIGGALMVSAPGGMQVSVDVGRAWFNGTWTNNDADLLLDIDAAGAALPRWDLVVLEINEDTGVRVNSIKIIKGEAATSPSEPSLTNTDDIHQYPLARVVVGATVTEILTANIVNKVGTSECPFVTGILETVSVDDLLVQWNAEFQDWFDNVVAVLDEEVAGNLLNMINALDASTSQAILDSYNSLLTTMSEEDDILSDRITEQEGVANIKIAARQGGSPTSWEQTGVNNYTPSKAVIQVGNKYISGSEGNITVTFPTPFAYKPIILVTPDPTSTPGAYLSAAVIEITTTGFIAKMISHTNTIPYHAPAVGGYTASWIAIGPLE